MQGNNTRNQHFVTRVEQKLNAINPGNATSKFRIYSFRITDRDTYKIDLESPRGHAIERTLSMFDLFSFDVPHGGRIRSNLEELFHRYEANIESDTRSLLEKLSRSSPDIKNELVNLFAAKLLNFIRNPFCIEKVLNSFPAFRGYEPTDPGLLVAFRRIASGQKPHQNYLCQKLGISHETYVDWLRLLFLLLVPLGNGQQNLFESVIKGLFEGRDTQAGAFVWIYDQDYCLLSDRGFCHPVPDGPHMMAMSFNLCSTAFVDYAFADAATLMKGRAPPEFLLPTLDAWRRRPHTTINVTVRRNDRQSLARYNRRVIEWSRERVYCAVKTGIVVS